MVSHVSHLPQIPAIRHYWDALDMGLSPASAMDVASKGKHPSTTWQAILQLRLAGDTARRTIHRRTACY